MAHSLFREPNQVKWVGIRPAHNGERITAEGIATNTTVDVYSIPIGKTLFLTWSSLSGRSNTSATLLLEVTDNLNNHLFTLHQGRTPSGGAGFDSDTALFYPIEIDGDNKIRVNSSSIALDATGAIYGWIE